MERTATWNGVRFASFLDARNAAAPHVDAAHGVYQTIEVWNSDGTLYKGYTLGKVPAPVATPAPTPTPTVDALAALTARVEALEAAVAALASAALKAPRH